jgi:cytoskeleton protein RodZ
MAARQPEPPVLAVPQPKSVMVDYTSQPQEGLADALHLLRVQAKEETWLRVTIDDQHAKDVLLRPGQVVEWSAGAGFTLTLGNAGGVEVILDGQGLPPFGKSGQVIRNIRLPMQG